MKRVFDLICAIILMGCLWLPMLTIAALIRISSKGPALYWSDRIGQNNAVFRMPKFRTMHLNTPAIATHLLSDSENHVTPLGRYLRKLSLDELPQLFSILKGDMSFVGPRPERAVFVKKFKKQIPFYTQRFSLRPGLTGWAQIRSSYASNLEQTVEKLRYELYYLKNFSLLFDLTIILRTIKVVLFAKGS